MVKLFTALEEYDNPHYTEIDMLRDKIDLQCDSNNIDINSSLSEINKLHNIIESSEIQLKSMEKLYTTLESFKDTGINQQTAQILQVSVETIGMTLGDKNLITLPSLESFESDNSRIISTEIALETIGEKIKETLLAIWKVIKEFLNKVAEFLLHVMEYILFPIIRNAKKRIDYLKKLDPNAKGIIFYNTTIAKGFGLPDDSVITEIDIISLIQLYNSSIIHLRTDEDMFRKLSKNTDNKRSFNTYTDKDVDNYIIKINNVVDKIVTSNTHLFNATILTYGEDSEIGSEKLKSLSAKSLWNGRENLAEHIKIDPVTNNELMTILTNIVSSKNISISLYGIRSRLFIDIKEEEIAIKLMNRSKYSAIFSEADKNTRFITMKTFYMIAFYAKTIAKGYGDTLKTALLYVDKSIEQNIASSSNTSDNNLLT